MSDVERKEEHRERLLAIAREELGMDSLAETGKYTTDNRLVRVCSVANALERAYDLGLLAGFMASRANRQEAGMDSKSKRRFDRAWVRAG